MPLCTFLKILYLFQQINMASIALPQFAVEHPHELSTGPTNSSSLPIAVQPSTDCLSDILLPNFFIGFCRDTPVVHESYNEIKKTNEAYYKDLLQLSQAKFEKMSATDLAYFTAVWANDATKERVQTVADWLQWLFDFDDLYDDGVFRHDLEAGIKLARDMMAITDAPPDPSAEFDHPLLTIYHGIWQRIYTSASKNTRAHFVEASREYILEVLNQDESMATKSLRPGVETYLEMRRKTIAGRPCMGLAEYTYGLDLPAEIYEHEVLEELRSIIVDLFSLHNDSISFAKDQGEEFEWNLVHALRQDNPSLKLQGAFDIIGQMIADRFERWDAALTRLPSWGKQLDSEVAQYVRSISGIIIANLNWSFRSERYFRQYNSFVRATRIVPVALQADLMGSNLLE